MDQTGDTEDATPSHAIRRGVRESWLSASADAADEAVARAIVIETVLSDQQPPGEALWAAADQAEGEVAALLRLGTLPSRMSARQRHLDHAPPLGRIDHHPLAAPVAGLGPLTRVEGVDRPPVAGCRRSSVT